MTEMEFVILVNFEKGMNRLAGRRGTIRETFVEKNTGYWGPRWCEPWIEHWSLQRAQDWDRRHPLSSITVHVLSSGMRINALDSDCMRNRQSEGPGGQTNSHSADGEDDHEDMPARVLVRRESCFLRRFHWSEASSCQL